MPAAGPVAIFALLFAAGDLQVGAGAQAELRAGQTPLLAGQSPSNFFMALLTADADLYWATAEGESSLRYAPRLLWRDPSPNDQIAPLILHVFGASHRDRLTRRIELVLQADGSFGEVDYAYLGQTLPGQAALPTASRILSLLGSARVAWRASRRTSLQAGLSLLNWRTLDSTTAPTTAAASGTTLLPVQTRLAFLPQLSYLLSRRDTLVVHADLTYNIVQGSSAGGSLTSASGFSALAWQPQLAWQHELGRRDRLELQAGVVIAHMFADPCTTQSFAPIAPIGGARLASLLYQSRDVKVRGDVSGAVSWNLDPVLRTGVPRGQGNAGIGAAFGPLWSAELSGMVSTNLTRDALPGDPDETMFMARLPVRFQASRHFVLEAGARYSDRAPHLSAPGFSWHGRESLAYVMLAVVERASLLSAGPNKGR